MKHLIKTAAPYALTAVLSVGGFLVYNLGMVHALGLRHGPGACEGCDVGGAQVTMNLVQKAQAAAVGSAQ